MGMSMSSKPNPCPLCRKPMVLEHNPFCSQGCKDRDLLNWLGETYRVAVNDDNDDRDSGLDSNPEA